MTVGVFACLQVDNDRRDMDMNDKDVDAEKMTRFVRMNELRLVTEYNPVVITSSPQPSPWPLTSSSWVSSGPKVCMPRCVQGLWQWCGCVWGSHTTLCCYSMCEVGADVVLGHASGAWQLGA